MQQWKNVDVDPKTTTRVQKNQRPGIFRVEECSNFLQDEE
jgi:hypothetical protein